MNLLPASAEGRDLRHAVEVRHDSFRSTEFTAMARELGVAVVIAADGDHPQIADPTASFIYARIMGTQDAEDLGYCGAALDLWAERARAWARGKSPDGLEYVASGTSAGAPRDVYLYVIGGHKERNPAAAMALIERTR